MAEFSKTNLHRTICRDDNILLHAGTVASSSDDIPVSKVSMSLDEVAHKLKFKVKYSDGTVKYGEISLVS